VTTTTCEVVEVSLRSADPALKGLLGDILGEIRDSRCVLNLVSPDETPGSTDLCLWDYDPGRPLPIKSGFRASRHLFLVNPGEVAEFRDTIGSAEASIILKPAARNTLKSALCLAISAHQDRIASAASLREQRDDLLQSLIQTSLHVQDHDHERTSFVGRAAHDFRAPATAIAGYCGLLLGEHPGPLNETQKEVLQRMQVSARRLSRMASAMFALSFGRNARPPQELVENDVRDCVEQALQEIMTFADEKRIAITAELAPCDFPLFFDRGQIEQVLINILGNSCKFSPRSGVISVFGYTSTWESSRVGSLTGRRHGAQTDANCYRIDIQDSGSPIPNDHLQRIFEEYTYSDGNRDRSDGGLGLAVTRIIMAQHDGHVWAENTASGPRFSVVLPRRNGAKSGSCSK
jgi:signal transduction histidine kinase